LFLPYFGYYALFLSSSQNLI